VGVASLVEVVVAVPEIDDEATLEATGSSEPLIFCMGSLKPVSDSTQFAPYATKGNGDVVK